MLKLNKYLLLLNLLVFVNLVSGQGENDSLMVYTSEFKFTEGVFVDFQSVKMNRPIPKSRILTNYSYSDKDFFDKVLAQKDLIYYDNVGNKLNLKVSKLWGYSRNGYLYIRVNGSFYRIPQIGSISHFVAYKTYETYNSTYNNYYHHSHPYSYNSPTSTSTEMEQYMLDFNTGNVMEYDIEGLEVALMADPELHDEYMQLSKKKKRQLKFVYVRKFNERNPLYLIKK